MKPGVPYVPKVPSDTVRFGFACGLAAFTLIVLRAMFAPDTSEIGAIVFCMMASIGGVSTIYQIVRLAQIVEKES